MYPNDNPNFTYPNMPMYPGMPGIPGAMPGMPYPNVPRPTEVPPGRPGGSMPSQIPGTMPIPKPGTLPAMPGAFPTMPGTLPSPFPPGVAPIFEQEPGAPVETDPAYTQGFLRTQIGRYVKIDFLIGTNMFIDLEGTLVDVGISYVLIREPETDDLVLCDIYAIKFVRIFY